MRGVGGQEAVTGFVVALLLLIRATLPLSADVQALAEELRAVAVKAGCAEPLVAMYWLGGDRGVEVEVTCP